MKILILLSLASSLLFSSMNTFFVIKETMNLTCNDANDIKLDKNSTIVKFTYNESGKEKLSNITGNNIGGRLGLVVDDRVIFFDIKIWEDMAKGDSMNTVSFSAKTPEDALLFYESFGTCK